MDEIDRVERRLKLHDVRVLMSVVQAGSMGKAAKRLATSQPAISRSIADLESALGVRLLDRSPKGIEPTPYGRALLKRGTVVFDELKQGVRDRRGFCFQPCQSPLSAISPPRLSDTGHRYRDSIPRVA